MKRTMAALALILGLVVLGQPAETGVALAQAGSTYTVNITNLTPGQSFTPILTATHSAAASVFLPGTTASAALGTLAETGDVAPLTALLTSMPAAVMQVVSGSGLTTPGVTTSLTIMGGGTFDRLSIATMLIPTNDTFLGVNTALPADGELKVVYGFAYDADTEVNDETCASIPGPNFVECGGPGMGGAPGNGDLLVYFRERASRTRPYLSGGFGIVRFETDSKDMSVDGSLPLPPTHFSSTDVVLRVAVGVDVPVGHGWNVRYSFSESVGPNPISRKLDPPGSRGLMNFQNLLGLMRQF